MIRFQDIMEHTHQQMQLKYEAEARKKQWSQLNQELTELCDYHRTPSQHTVHRLEEIGKNQEFPDLAQHATRTLKWIQPLLGK